MALKLISRINQKPAQPIAQPQEQMPTDLGSAARTLGGGALGLVKNIEAAGMPSRSSVEQAIQDVAKLTKTEPVKFQEPQRFSTQLQQAVGVNPQQLEPKNIVEDIAQTTISSLPLTFLLGSGSLGTRLARDVVGTTAMKGVESVGGGPLSQLFAGMLGSSGFNKFYNYFKKGGDPTTLMNLADTARQKAYTTEKELGAKVVGPAQKYAHGLDKLYSEIKNTTVLNKTDKGELLEKLSRLESDIAGNKINGSKLIERKQEINRAWKEAQGPKDFAYRRYLNKTRDILKDTAEDIGQGHPKWLESWKTGDRITSAMNYKPELLEVLEEYPKLAKIITNPLAKELLGIGAGGAGGALLGGVPGAVLGAATSAGLSKGTRKAAQLWGFVGHPATNKLLYEAFENTINRNIPELIRSYHKLNKLADKYEQKIDKKQKSNAPGKLKLIYRAQ